MEVELVDAKRSDAATEWLRNVYPLYLHDLSEFHAGYKLDDRGHWSPDYLPYWLSNSFCHPLVIRSGKESAGFALIGSSPFPYMAPGCDFRIAEFFVLRSFRRSGIARVAATAVLKKFSGTGEIAVLMGNQRAVHFWRQVLAAPPVKTWSEMADEDRVTFICSVSLAKVKTRTNKQT